MSNSPFPPSFEKLEQYPKSMPMMLSMGFTLGHLLGKEGSRSTKFIQLEKRPRRVGIGDYVHETNQGSQIPKVTIDTNIPREGRDILGTKKDEYPKIPLGWEHDQS